MGARDVTFRDAGLHSRPLRAINRLGQVLRSAGVELPALTPKALTDAAVRKTGLEDFGPSYQGEALEVLCESVAQEADLTTFGRIAARGLVVGALENRLRLIEWSRSCSLLEWPTRSSRTPNASQSRRSQSSALLSTREIGWSNSAPDRIFLEHASPTIQVCSA